ncbi:hypothetical protein HAX54_026905 [Datura stramonium]|uniref:Uncharacterized protein n=1 Tax=Datura stramonium TaxID=4076 RepID=A0ABS8V249_DATST|nr:hypothetical protein [Datura stramonium]
MGAGLKKDLRVSRVGPGGSLNAFFFLIELFHKDLPGEGKKGTSTLGAQYNGELYAAFGKDESTEKSIDSLPIGEVSGSSPGWPSCARKELEEASDYFMHAPLARGYQLQLVELRSCNWVVAITGWMSNCPGGMMYLVPEPLESAALPRFPHLNLWGKRIKLALANSLMLSPFNPWSEMHGKRKEGKSIPSSHPARTRDHPKDAFGIQRSRTDHRTLVNKWNALAVRSGWAVRVGEGNDSFLKPAFLRPKSRAERGSPPFLVLL